MEGGGEGENGRWVRGECSVTFFMLLVIQKILFEKCLRTAITAALQ